MGERVYARMFSHVASLYGGKGKKFFHLLVCIAEIVPKVRYLFLTSVNSLRFCILYVFKVGVSQ